jgi:hypothetical protein
LYWIEGCTEYLYHHIREIEEMPERLLVRTKEIRESVDAGHEQTKAHKEEM